MRRLSSRFRSALALALATASLGLAGSAHAQACCAGAGVFAPARLKFSEDALVGLQLHARDTLGSLDPDGKYVSAPSGTRELSFEQDLLGVIRVLENGQVGVSIPLVETRREVPNLSETGAGLGDIALTGRYEFVPPNTSPTLPGISLILGITLPTGTPADGAHKPLATDATGIGAVQGTLGLDVERAFGRYIFDVTGALTQRLPRTVGGVRERLGLQASGFLAFGYVVHREAALALSFAMTGERAAVLNGEEVPGSARLLTSVGISGGLPLGAGWRIQARLFEDLPALGKNQTSGPGLTATVLRTW